MRKWIGWILLAAVVLTVVNDGGRFIVGIYKLDEASRSMIAQATTIASRDPSANSAWPTVQDEALARGVEVTGFEQTGDTVTIGLRSTVAGTWVAGPVRAYLAKLPTATPFPLTRVARGQF